MARRAPPKLPPSDELVKLASDAIVDFEVSPELESALGMLFVGHAFGWRVLYMIHSVATIRKYEKVLGISLQALPERTPHSREIERLSRPEQGQQLLEEQSKARTAPRLSSNPDVK